MPSFRTIAMMAAVTAGTMLVLNILAASNASARRVIKGSYVTGVAA